MIHLRSHPPLWFPSAIAALAVAPLGCSRSSHHQAEQNADAGVAAGSIRDLDGGAGDGAGATTPAAIAGNWVGEYVLDGKRTYASVILKADKEALTGTMLTPLEDGAERRPLGSVSLVDDRVSFQSSPSDGSVTFEGRIEKGSMRGRATREHSSGPLELVHVARIEPDRLDRYVGDYETECFGGPSNAILYPVDVRVSFQEADSGAIPTLTFGLGGAPAVSAKKQHLYEIEDASFHNGNVTLSGSLRVPPAAGLHPAVVMLAGSNAQSRYGQDGILGFNADFLARLGFAVLSYDKRGTGKSTGSREDIGLDGDALAAIAWLRQRKDIDSKRIGLWGISQGGMIAPQVAAQTSVAFIVSVSGDVVRGDRQEIERVELQLRADGFPEDEIREAVAFQRLKFSYARTGKGWDEYAAAYDRYKDRKWFPDPYVGPPASKDDPGFEVWRKGAGSISPGDYWEKFRNPALVVFGEFETYSKPASNIARFTDAMKKAGNTHYTVAIIPGAEHTMREAKNGGPRELPYLNRFVPLYFATLRDWLQKNVMAQVAADSPDAP